jgi:hypothetical protein
MYFQYLQQWLILPRDESDYQLEFAPEMAFEEFLPPVVA